MNIKLLLKYTFWGVVWAVVFIILGFIIEKLSTFSLKDIFFVEGILLVILGAASCIGGNPLGLSIQALGQTNAQYAAYANLEVTKMEKEKLSKFNFRTAFNLISLVLAGVICIVINFII